MRALAFASAMLVLGAAAAPGQEPAVGPAPAFEAEALRRSASAVLTWMQGRGAAAEYQLALDEERGFTYLHAGSEQQLAAARRRLEELARLLWRDLFRVRNREPIHVVLLRRDDGPAMFPPGHQGGYFLPAMNALVCDDVPASVHHRCSPVVHELVHALHFADRRARGEEHPVWVVEGLACLFETSSVVEDRLVPHHSARLSAVQRALREGNALPWRTLMRMSRDSFHAQQVISLAYAQARYVLFYAHAQGLLRRLYDELAGPVGRADPSGVAAVEAAFGRPLEEVEAGFAAWVQEQRIPPGPFLGVATTPAEGGSLVTHLAPGSGAEAAGIRVDDLLVSAEGVALPTQDQLVEVLSTRFPGEVVELELLRAGERLRVAVTLGSR